MITSRTLYVLIIYTFFGSSCNKVLFADRTRILREQNGYLFEQRNQMIFIPMDTDKDFFAQINGKNGYRIYQSPGYEGPKYAQGDSIKIEMHYSDSTSGNDALFSEKVYLIRVKIKYTDDKKSLSRERSEIKFDYDGKTYSFTGYANRYVQVYQVVGVLSLLDKK